MFGAGLTDFIITSGLLVVAATIFVECGFFGGFFLPGDTLLFLAGFIAGRGTHNIVLTIVLIFLAAVLGNATGYHVGRQAGPRLFHKDDGIFFRKEHIVQAQQFYARHGGKTLILARFIPVMRTFAPLVAGIADMPFRRFLAFSSVGALLWSILIPSLGFWSYRVLGHSFDIEKYVLPIVLSVMVLTIGGSALHAVFTGRRQRSRPTPGLLEHNQAEVDKQID